jgi:hypothetical protein
MILFVPIHARGQPVAYPGILSLGWGVQQIQLRTKGRDNRDLGAVALWLRVPINLQMSKTRILIRLLRIYFPRISEFGSASEFRGGGDWTPPNPPRSATVDNHLYNPPSIVSGSESSCCKIICITWQPRYWSTAFLSVLPFKVTYFMLTSETMIGSYRPDGIDCIDYVNVNILLRVVVICDSGVV